MKDAAILTKFYKNYNYGGMLQGYALRRAVKNLGYSVNLISYDVNANRNPVYPGLRQQVEQYGITAAAQKAGEKSIAKLRFFISDMLSRRKALFDEFMEMAGADTDIIDDERSASLCEQYKAFISGSDQIWNPNAVRELYLQTFVDDPARKISYAASIGRDSLSDREASVLIPAIRKFGSISVREKTAQKLLEEYMDARVVTSVDPTMLLSAEEWSEVASESPAEGDYALVYFFSNSLRVRQRTEQFLKKRGLKMVFIPYAKQEYNVTDSYGPGERMENVGPREFVSLVKNAKFVLTDSFHGAVFSLIFKRPFAVFERNKSGHVSMNSRLYDLLNLFEESYRLVEERETRDLGYLFDVDEDKIGRIMAAERERSLDYLKNAIDDAIQAADRREAPVTVSGEEDRCTGCSACAAVCPAGCISMESNPNGFLVPQIDASRCIKCGKCLRTCPVQGKRPSTFKPIRCLGAHTVFEEKESASGGIGGTLAGIFTETGGIAYGSVYGENMRVAVRRAAFPKETEAFRGSKYVQSFMGNTVNEVISDLAAGEKVLFTGTPCQIAGIRAAVSACCPHAEERLFTAEIICHGVPSPEMFRKYLHWLWEKNGQKVDSYRFRAKESDADPDFMIKIGLENGKEVTESGFRDPYYKIFLTSKWFRKSCYKCPFAAKERVADLTMGDFWNAEMLPKDFGKGRRVSVILVNNTRGEALLKLIFGELEAVDVLWKTAAQGNTNLIHPTPMTGMSRGFAEITDPGAFFDREASGKINNRRYWFNQLPQGVRRGIKGLMKHPKHK